MEFIQIVVVAVIEVGLKAVDVQDLCHRLHILLCLHCNLHYYCYLQNTKVLCLLSIVKLMILNPCTLKRPARVNNTKSAMKDSHLPKIPDHKSGPHSLLKTSKSSMLGTSQLKHNQIAHPSNIFYFLVHIELSILFSKRARYI